VFHFRTAVAVLGLLISIAYATVAKEIEVTTSTDEWSGDKSRMAEAVIEAPASAGDADLVIGVLKTAKQESGSQGAAMMQLWCKDFPASQGNMSLKVFYADSSSKVITQTMNADGELADIAVAFQNADADRGGYWYMSVYLFRTDEQVLKNAVRLVAKVTWQEPYLTEMAFAGTGYFVFGASDLREARKVLNYEFTNE
jgi:hypothetical protein